MFESTPLPLAGERPAIVGLRPPSAATTAGIVAAVVAWVLVVRFAEPFGRLWGTGQDARCYWLPSLAAPYANADWTSPIAYVYSPAFLQLVAPLTSLPWQLFMAIWTAILLAAVAFLTGPRLLALGVAVAAMELAGGNISLLLAVAIVLGFRWPAAWAFVLLTKITPGIGLIWFAARREWRSLGIALGATLAVVVASAAFVPHAWAEWFGVLTSIAGRDGTWAAIPIPLWARVPVAIGVVVWGARTDRRWAVPVASMIALPALWYGGLSMLLAVLPLSGERGREAAGHGGGTPATAGRRVHEGTPAIA